MNRFGDWDDPSSMVMDKSKMPKVEIPLLSTLLRNEEPIPHEHKGHEGQVKR